MPVEVRAIGVNCFDIFFCAAPLGMRVMLFELQQSKMAFDSSETLVAYREYHIVVLHYV